MIMRTLSFTTHCESVVVPWRSSAPSTGLPSSAPSSPTFPLRLNSSNSFLVWCELIFIPAPTLVSTRTCASSQVSRAALQTKQTKVVVAVAVAPVASRWAMMRPQLIAASSLRPLLSGGHKWRRALAMMSSLSKCCGAGNLRNVLSRATSVPQTICFPLASSSRRISSEAHRSCSIVPPTNSLKILFETWPLVVDKTTFALA